MKTNKFYGVTEKVARGFIVLFLMVSSSFFIVSCNSEEIPVDEIESLNNDLELYNKDANYYLSYSDALLLSNQLINASRAFFNDSIDVNSTTEPELEEYFWAEDQGILSDVSSKIGLEVDFVPDNLNQFDDFNVDEQQINSANFLTQMQKSYAIDFLNAANNNDMTELISIKNKFMDDVKIYPELEIFNLGIALIESSQGFASRDCNGAGVNSGVVSGVIGMVGGAIAGGIGGVVAGFGVFSVPAGGAGAVVGAVLGGVLGFASGYVRGWLACQIFG